MKEKKELKNEDVKIKKEKIKQMKKNIKIYYGIEDKKLAEEIINLNEDVTYLNREKGIPFKK